MSQPGLDFVFEAEAELGAPVEAGLTHRGQRRVIAIGDGRFAGHDMSGVIMPGGVDWQVVRPDGIVAVEARYVLRTDDGVMIHVVNTGVRHGPPEVMSRLAAGEPVDPASYYFRTTPVFEAPAGRYDWLNRHVFVCVGERMPRAIRLRFYRVT